MLNIDLGFFKNIDECEQDRAIYESALFYIKVGIKILPQKRDTKGYIKNLGIEHATLSPEVIKHWFGPGGPYEGYNLLGVLPDGVVVLDFDHHPGKEDVFEATGLTKRDLLDGLCVFTSGGGAHFYTLDHKVTFFKKIPGLEKKTAVLWPPSIVNGVRYTWGRCGEPGSSPEKMLDSLGGKSGKKKKEVEEFGSIAPDDFIRELLSYFDPGGPYDEWRAVGMALHDNDHGQGHLDLWIEWSEQSAKFKPGECEGKWESFNADRSRKVTLAWMIYEAKQRGREATAADMKYSGINMDAYAAVMDMNKRFVCTLQGGPSILTLDKGEVIHTTATQFKVQVAANIAPILVGERYVPAAEYWLKSKYRREGRIVMEYPGTENEGDVNVYKGFNIKPVPCRPEEIQLFLDHTLNVICSGNREHCEFLLDMLAQKLQQPLDLLGIALVLKGKEGTGKSSFCNIFSLIIGPTHTGIATSRSTLLGQYSGGMASKILVVGEEAVFSANKGEAERLKALITESPLDWNNKNIKQWSQKNCLMLMFTTNEDWAIPAGMDSRRFFVLKISDIHPGGDDEYWLPWRALMGSDNNGVPYNPEYLGKILHFFLTRKITHSLSKAMVTDELLEQRKLTSADSMDAAFAEWVRRVFIRSKEDESMIEGLSKDFTFPVVTYKNEAWVETEDMFADFRAYYKRNHAQGRGCGTDKDFKLRLAELGMPVNRVKKKLLKVGPGKYPGSPESKIRIVRRLPPDTLEDALAKRYKLFAGYYEDEETDDDQ